jgi:hypothetical protein
MMNDDSAADPITPIESDGPAPVPPRPPLPARPDGHRLRRVIGGLWLGSGAFILISASAIFGAAGTPSVAANVVGAMLLRWHYISLLAPAVLLLMEWRRARGHLVAILFAAVVMAAGQALVDVRIRQIRLDSPVPISSLLQSDPLRRRFGFLHGVSSLLLVAQTIAAAAFLAARQDT